MKIGDRFILRGNHDRSVTVTGFDSAGHKVYFIFDDSSTEDNFPYEEFGWWFEPMTELPKGKTHDCICGGFTTYKSMDDLYHTRMCLDEKYRRNS